MFAGGIFYGELIYDTLDPPPAPRTPLAKPMDLLEIATIGAFLGA